MADEKINIHIDAAQKRPELPAVGETGNICPNCKSELETAFGMAGGGYGVYEFCHSCERVITKDDEPLFE